MDLDQKIADLSQKIDTTTDLPALNRECLYVDFKLRDIMANPQNYDYKKMLQLQQVLDKCYRKTAPITYTVVCTNKKSEYMYDDTPGNSLT